MAKMQRRVRNSGSEDKTRKAKSAYGKTKKFLGDMRKAYNGFQKFLK